jgi:hypothetical protein
MHPYLPRETFDLKTRATAAIRMNASDYAEFVKYRLYRSHGFWNSFIREYYDMTRSAFLKYSFQVRIGNMDGLFVAYHNTQEIFGFQYVAREELDQVLFGNSQLGDQAFTLSLSLLNLSLNQVMSTWGDVKAFRLTFAATDVGLDLYAEDLSPDRESRLQKWTIQLTRMINGTFVSTLPDLQNEDDRLDLRYVVQRFDEDCSDEFSSLQRRVEKRMHRVVSDRDKEFLRRLFQPRFSETDHEGLEEPTRRVDEL